MIDVNFLWWLKRGSGRFGIFLASVLRTMTLNLHILLSCDRSNINSKSCSGCRRLIFDDGQRTRACYDFRNPGHSIWYPDESNDLHISLLFKKGGDALNFIGQLANYQTFKRFRFGLTFEREPV